MSLIWFRSCNSATRFCDGGMICAFCTKEKNNSKTIKALVERKNSLYDHELGNYVLDRTQREQTLKGGMSEKLDSPRLKVSPFPEWPLRTEGNDLKLRLDPPPSTGPDWPPRTRGYQLGRMHAAPKAQGRGSHPLWGWCPGQGHVACALTRRNVSAFGRKDAAAKKVINNLLNLSINRIRTQANLRSPEHCFFFF